MNTAVFGKTVEMFENTDIKLLTTETRRNYSASESNYHTTNFTKYIIQIIFSISNGNEENSNNYE